jgi:drug/metabolite transporter (DMT)-like permease
LSLVGAILFAPLMVLDGPSAPDLHRAWPYLVGIALAGTAIPLVLVQAGMSRVGATPAALLSLLEPVIAVVLAQALLGERLGPVQLAGTLLVFASFPLATAGGLGVQSAPHG